MRILVVDDNTNSLQSICLVLRDMGHEPIGADDPSIALDLALESYFPLIITDIRMPGMNGLDLLSRLKESGLESDVVLVTGHGDMTTAVEALRKGAYDYLNKPINARELAAVVDRSAERQALIMENRELKEDLSAQVSLAAESIRQDLEKARQVLREVEGIGLVVAESPVMQDLMREALILHKEPSVPVLIEGETGTGKEVMARFIHYGEGVSDSPFLAINCAAIPHELFENELFGHEAGSFTGSRAEGASGKLEQAGKGTLFLDEVAEMPLSLQPKLLRVLQERSFYRVGGIKKRQFEARIVCAGNKNMADMVEQGTFRRDLYHRLRVGHLYIPPLRERPEDVRALADHFLAREAKRKKKSFTALAPATLAAMQRHTWPGNVRELENAIERAVLMHDGELLLPAYIAFLFQNNQSAASASAAKEAAASRMPDPSARASATGTEASRLDLSNPDNILLPNEPLNLELLIDSLTAAALKRFNGNKSKTAEYLGISRFALHRRLNKEREN